MNALDFIGYLDGYCSENDILFAPNEAAYTNITADHISFTPDRLILCSDLSLSPVFGEQGNVESVTYTGFISLGRKREENTESNLDESFMQKYNARLLDLVRILMAFFEKLSCEEEVTIDRCDISYVINEFDLNADFVQANISLSVNYFEED